VAGHRLRLLRGLTQRQLADLGGTKQSSIARLERGTTPPNLSFLSKVAAALVRQEVAELGIGGMLDKRIGDGLNLSLNLSLIGSEVSILNIIEFRVVEGIMSKFVTMKRVLKND
jgi:transcriptional regulator with XRE-family HTH domain